MRITEGEKANLHIGDRVPIPVTTFNTQQTSGGNIIPITSFQYQDVGIRIDIEPRVHHNKEITLKLKIEVSQITGFQDAGGGQRQPIIGTRTIESTIRLKDGETNFLAGLIRSDETNSETGLPGLSDIPVLRALFGKTTVDIKRTDVMLTLTPHIIRTPDVTPSDLAPIWVGTESNLTFRGGSPRIVHVAEYYNWTGQNSVRTFVNSTLGVTENPSADGIHDEYGLTAVMMLSDPKIVRYDERVKAGKATINGISIEPRDKTIEMGKKIVEFRANAAVEAIRKAIAK